ncbi:MAG: hypothetical protein GF353_28225 [Candidatus Lokiarchaeota archaeon]|nr:hypothetical protein [Candidatus Lokiarchaeota archaeon]
MLPTFLVIGGHRCGTTWLYKNFLVHPEIYVPTKYKEIHFFDREFNKGLKHYETFFEERKKEKVIGEVTPNYLHNKNVAKRIFDTIPDTKIIVSLRNPIDRLYSHFWLLKSNWKKNRDITFEEKMASKPDMLQEGIYYNDLIRYFEFFDKERILVLLFDELQSDPKKLLKRVYNFLGVRLHYSHNIVNNKVNSADSRRLLAKSKFLYLIQRAAEKAKLHDFSIWIDNKNKTTLPNMNPETRKWLVEFYWKENEKLSELINIDLSRWNN